MKDLTLPAREHLDGCPADRQETYEITRPNGEHLVVVRCISCGGQAIYPKGKDETDEQES